MTREEIDRAGAHILATSVHELTWADGFETGVKFNEEKTADRIKKEVISKACELLDSNFPSIDNIGSWYKEGFIKQFKQLMESCI